MEDAQKQSPPAVGPQQGKVAPKSDGAAAIEPASPDSPSPLKPGPCAPSATPLEAATACDKEARREFLLTMYAQMWSNIDRHTLIVWQSIAAVVASFAVFAISEKVGDDVSCAVVTLSAGWLIANLFDSNAWCVRNLSIITNIERQFLFIGDGEAISHYFLRDRTNRMQPHLRVQLLLGLTLLGSVLTYHFATRVWAAGFSGRLDVVRVVPYVIAVIYLLYAMHSFQENEDASHDFTKLSPGKEMPPTSPVAQEKESCVGWALSCSFSLMYFAWARLAHHLFGSGRAPKPTLKRVSGPDPKPKLAGK